MKNIAEAASLCLEDELPHAGGVFVGVRDLYHRARLSATDPSGDRQGALTNNLDDSWDRLLNRE